MENIIVESKQAAWDRVNEIFPTDYELDDASTQGAGYNIYRHRVLNYYSRICDLGDRLEILLGEFGEKVINIWIKPREQFKATVTYYDDNMKVFTKEIKGFCSIIQGNFEDCEAVRFEDQDNKFLLVNSKYILNISISKENNVN